MVANLAGRARGTWRQHLFRSRDPARTDDLEPLIGHTTTDVELEPLPPPALDGQHEATYTSGLQADSRERIKRREKLYQLLERDSESAMKFSHSIQFNAVPDWSSHYISYSNLKKLIYQLEKQHHHHHHQSLASSKLDGDGQPQDAENSPLLHTSSGAGAYSDDPDTVFTRKLDDELDKICSFYQLKELEIHGEVDGLMKDVEEFQAEHAAGEAMGEGGGLRRQSLWARARQQSIFKSFQIGNSGAGGASNKARRRTSTAGTLERGIPEETEPHDDDSEEEHHPITESTNLTQSHDSLSRPARSSNTHRRDSLAAPNDLLSSDRHSANSLRRRPSTAFNDFDSEALDALYSEGITLKKRLTNLYVSVCELRSYIQLNRTGFTKVLKKYDKTLDRALKSSYISSHIEPAYPFLPATLESLNQRLAEIEQAYAGMVSQGDVEAARRALRLHLREHVVWERNTVWREMIGIERKAQAANLGIRGTMLGDDGGGGQGEGRLQGDEAEGATKEVGLSFYFSGFLPSLGRFARCSRREWSGHRIADQSFALGPNTCWPI